MKLIPCVVQLDNQHHQGASDPDDSRPAGKYNHGTHAHISLDKY